MWGRCQDARGDGVRMQMGTVPRRMWGRCQDAWDLGFRPGIVLRPEAARRIPGDQDSEGDLFTYFDPGTNQVFL
eukprot:73276-Chlamydomonas_euryale.AAC.2